MTDNLILLPADLQLFEGEGTGAPTGESSMAPAAGEQTGEIVTQDAAGPTEPAPSLEERTKAYKDLIGGEYKDIHTQEVQKIINRRFAEMKNLQKTNADQQAIIDRLAAKYGVTDLAELGDAIDNDTAMWEREADEAGMTTDQYMKFQALQRQNAQLIREQQAQEQQAQRQMQVQKWMNEAQAVMQGYPEFNLEAELENPEFASLLQAGIPMEHAYEVIHLNDIKQATARTAAAQTEKAVTDNIRARGTRPTEAGAGSHSAFTTATDINKMSLEEMEALNKRARYGETIDFVNRF